MTIRIVLADDHAILREALRTMLEKEPDLKIVGEAEDGNRAIALVRELSPDILVVDIAMPNLNGVDATARLTARHPGTKVIALSAYADKRFVLEMFKAGASGYVTKAGAGVELLRAIRAVAQNQKYLCPEVAEAVLQHLQDGGMTSSPTTVVLGRREREVLQLLAEGERSAAIASRLNIAVSTVDVHRRNIMRKLNLHTTAELTKYAIREGVTTL